MLIEMIRCSSVFRVAFLPNVNGGILKQTLGGFVRWVFGTVGIFSGGFKPRAHLKK